MILMYDTAARNQEILDIRLKDMHVSNPELYVVITGKGRKTRMVPIMEKTVEHYEKYIRIFHKNSAGDAYLFYTLRNGKQSQMSPDNTEKFIKKYGEMAREYNKEVPTNVHPHMFRHYGESFKMVSGDSKPVKTVSFPSNHSPFYHCLPSEIRKSIRFLSSDQSGSSLVGRMSTYAASSAFLRVSVSALA